MTGSDPFGFHGDTLHEECGVFGIYGHADAGALAVLGLHALQHRGQEAAGIVTWDDGHFIAERHPGLVGDIFGRNSAAAANLKGQVAVGHVRYSTAGGSNARNIQPIYADLAGGGLAIAHVVPAQVLEVLGRGLGHRLGRGHRGERGVLGAHRRLGAALASEQRGAERGEGGFGHLRSGLSCSRAYCATRRPKPPWGR